MSRDQLFTVFFFAALALLLHQVYHVFYVFLAPFAWAAVFALVFYPVYSTVLRRLRQPALAALAMTVLIFHLVALPLFTFGSVAVRQAQHVYELVQEKAQSGEARTWVESWRDNRLVRAVARALPHEVRESVDLTDLGVRGAQAASQYLISQMGEIARNVVGFLVNFLLMLVVLFFFFRDGRRLYLSLRDLLPMEREHQDSIFRHLYETLAAVVQGMTVTSVLQALLSGLAFWVLDLPFAVLLGLTTAIASFVPLAGAALVWIPATAYFAIEGYWGRALALGLWGALVVSLVDNVVKPLVIGSRTKIPTLFLFFGILGGLQAYGVIGVFLGPVLLATIIAFLRIYREEYSSAA